MTRYKTLYLHIPFCHHVCHYCDFAKTALYTEDTVTRYFHKLEEYLKETASLNMIDTLDSIFFGGGTPGLFTHEYERIFRILSPFIKDHTEITLEANPLDITPTSLSAWRHLGINRLSLGVQTFDNQGLKFLTRHHTPDEALTAIALAQKHMGPNVNIDLIYGWNQQTETSWEKDLQHVIEQGIPHVSCYNLTYETGTTLGRQVQRGIVKPTTDEKIVTLYEIAKAKLSHLQHEEISNWSTPEYSCRHNWHYWRALPFLAFGVGAHGFLQEGPHGIRYSFTKSLKRFLDESTETFFSTRHSTPAIEFDELDHESALIEKIACGFRTREGIHIKDLEQIAQKKFISTPTLEKAILAEQIIYKEGYIKISPAEWIRENYWCSELIDCFHPLSQ